MARGDDIWRTSDTPNDRGVQNALHFQGSKAITFQQLLQSDDSKWSHISAQIKKKKNDQEDDGKHHNQKSVLAKIKEKAKKLKISLRRKKHSDTNDSRRPATRSSGVSPKDKGDEDAEYHSARMYESRHTPATNTQAVLSISGKHFDHKLNGKQNEGESASVTNITDACFKIHAPSDPLAADVDTKNQTETTNSRSLGLIVSSPESSKSKSDRGAENGENMKGVSQTPDKGLSVEEYLMHKFEPGEDERALSKVITQTLSPRRDKVGEAMSSFLKNEESSEVNSSNVDDSVNLKFKSKSLPGSTSTGSDTVPIKQSYSLGSNASKASLNLNQTFKSTFASYQDHFLSSSSNHDMIFNYSAPSSSTNTKQGSNQSLIHLNSTTKTSSSPLGHASNANETQAHVSSAKKTRVPSHTATSVRWVPVSRPNRVPIGTETNTIQIPISTANRTHANATRIPLSTGDKDRFRV